MSLVLEVIENKNVELTATDWYAAILGESPSKGAKSPVLWNTAFQALTISGMMVPMDVRPEKLGSVVRHLREDKKFIGGAVTMPYKIDIIPHLDALEPQAKSIGAVNCIYREGEKLVGTNTDGAGALWSLQQAYGRSLTDKTVLLFGTGGAGAAVAAYIASAIGPQGKLLIANRSRTSRDVIVRKLRNQCQVQSVQQWPVTSHDAKDADILINCTSIGFETVKQDNRGFYSLKYFSPLGPVDDTVRVSGQDNVEERYLKAAREEINENQRTALTMLSEIGRPLVFDIIYQPKETVFLNQAESSGCKTINGLPMNLEQAVIAFVKATGSVGLYDGDCGKVRSIMAEAK